MPLPQPELPLSPLGPNTASCCPAVSTAAGEPSAEQLRSPRAAHHCDCPESAIRTYTHRGDITVPRQQWVVPALMMMATFRCAASQSRTSISCGGLSQRRAGTCLQRGGSVVPPPVCDLVALAGRRIYAFWLCRRADRGERAQVRAPRRGAAGNSVIAKWPGRRNSRGQNSRRRYAERRQLRLRGCGASVSPAMRSDNRFDDSAAVSAGRWHRGPRVR